MKNNNTVKIHSWVPIISPIKTIDKMHTARGDKERAMAAQHDLPCKAFNI